MKRDLDNLFQIWQKDIDSRNVRFFYSNFARVFLKKFEERIKVNRDCLHFAMLDDSQFESKKQPLKVLAEELEFNSKLQVQLDKKFRDVLHSENDYMKRSIKSTEQTRDYRIKIDVEADNGLVNSTRLVPPIVAPYNGPVFQRLKKIPINDMSGTGDKKQKLIKKM